MKSLVNRSWIMQRERSKAGVDNSGVSENLESVRGGLGVQYFQRGVFHKDGCPQNKTPIFFRNLAWNLRAGACSGLRMYTGLV